jgi:hTAFII28-like protein conserved region
LCLTQLQQTIVGQQVNLNMTIVMCGIAKVFVGELIEAGVAGCACITTRAGLPAAMAYSQVKSGEPGLPPAAREIAEQRGEQGPLRMHHVHEAYQQLDREGRIPHRTPQQQHVLR